MKYTFTDKNYESTSGTLDVKKLSSIQERNEWVQNRYLSGDTIASRLEGVKETNSQILSLVDIIVEVEYSKDIVGKNYIIIEEKNIFDGYLFYFVREKNILENNNRVELTLELDPFMTFPDWIENLSNFTLQQGHSDFKNYFDYEFDGGRRKLISSEKLNKANGEEQVFTFVAYRRPTSYSLRAKINGEYQPYNIFFCPSVDRAVKIKNGSVNYKTSLKMFLDTFASPDADENGVPGYNDGLNYNIGIIPYDLMHKIGEQHNGEELYGLNGFGDIKSGVTGIGGSYLNQIIPIIDNYIFGTSDDINQNTYNIELDNDGNDFGLLKGLENSKITLKGFGDIDWDYNVLNENDRTQKLFIGSGLVPNDNKSFAIWNDQILEPTEENTFDNNTEISRYVNALNEYKASDPIGAHLDRLRPLEGLTNPLTYMAGPSGIAASLIGTASGVVGVGLSRLAKKKQPEKVEFNSDTYLVRSMLKDKAFMLVKESYEYIGNIKKGIVNSLYRNGMTYDGGLFIDNFAEIERPRFTYLSILDFSNYNLTGEYPEEVIEKFGEYLNSVRVWTDTTNYLNFDNTQSDNGDKI